MKKLVVFSSQGGNTKKLAEELFKQLPEDKDIAQVAEAPALSDYDVVCVGFWLKAGQPDPAAQEILKKCAGKIFLFATHGAAVGSDHAKMAMNKAEELAAEATVIGRFNCQGEVTEKMLETAANKNPQPPWLADAPAAKGHPDGNDFMNLSEALIEAGLKSKAEKSTGSMMS
ncbi:MAG: flavodoxin family protein [Desulfobulbaceae bacterium]|nr:flavodoxin family protein [Desulfobulbaceae bacterium]